jgi:molybdenum cofactor biosynthesis protein B
MMSHMKHKEKAPKSISCAVITASDSRTEETDTSGKIIQEQLAANSHTVIHYQIVKDEPDQIREVLRSLTENEQCQAIIVNGGTGISRRDTTFDVIDALLEKKLPGFGEIFRYLSYQQIGSAAILSRAVAGVCKGKVIFSIPGSPAAATLAMEKLILPEIAHIVWEIGR